MTKPNYDNFDTFLQNKVKLSTLKIQTQIQYFCSKKVFNA